MWTWDPSKIGITRGRNDEELVRYFEVEYGEEEVARLLAQARKLRRSLHGRVWSRVRARLAGRHEDGEATVFCLLPGPQNLRRCS